MFFISCFKKEKVNKEVHRMQCDCTLDPGKALIYRLHHMLNMVMGNLEHMNLPHFMR